MLLWRNREPKPSWTVRGEVRCATLSHVIALSPPGSVALVSSFSNPCVLVYAPGVRMDNTQVCLGQVDCRRLWNLE